MWWFLLGVKWTPGFQTTQLWGFLVSKHTRAYIWVGNTLGVAKLLGKLLAEHASSTLILSRIDQVTGHLMFTATCLTNMSHKYKTLVGHIRHLVLWNTEFIQHLCEYLNLQYQGFKSLKQASVTWCQAKLIRVVINILRHMVAPSNSWIPVRRSCVAVNWNINSKLCTKSSIGTTQQRNFSQVCSLLFSVFLTHTCWLTVSFDHFSHIYRSQPDGGSGSLVSDTIDSWLAGLKALPIGNASGFGACRKEQSGEHQHHLKEEMLMPSGVNISNLLKLLSTAAPMRSHAWDPLTNTSLWILSVGSHARNRKEQESLRKQLWLQVIGESGDWFQGMQLLSPQIHDHNSNSTLGVNQTEWRVWWSPIQRLRCSCN